MAKKKKVSYGAYAVVTGAGSGIGRAFSLEIARRGGQVVCSDINPASAAETVAMIEAIGGKAWAVACDVCSLEDVQALAETAAAKLESSVDLVINNAGIGVGGKQIGEYPIEDWHAAMNVNLWGVIHGCHVFAPLLRTLGRGGILNVASTASFAAAPTMGPYNVTKAAVLSLTETLSAELGATSIRVTALCPTFVKTNIIKSGRIEEKASNMASSLMASVGMSADKVARISLDGLDRGRLYVLPQIDARIVWRIKRWMPSSYTWGSGVALRMLERANAS